MLSALASRALQIVYRPAQSVCVSPTFVSTPAWFPSSQLISPFPPFAPLVAPIRFGARLSSRVCFLYTHSATTLVMIGWNLWRPRVLRSNLDTVTGERPFPLFVSELVFSFLSMFSIALTTCCHAASFIPPGAPRALRGPPAG